MKHQEDSVARRCFMPIEDRNLKPGTKLFASYKGQVYSCTVMEGDDKGGQRFMLEDNRLFKSPSAAGSAIMGGNACNGWRFWSLEGQEPKPKARKVKAEANPDAFEQMEDGRYFCNACAEAFEAPKGVIPQGCPQGHTAAQSNGGD